MHGRATKGAAGRRSRTGELVARLFGGQSARAGFAFVGQMARRDFQFRRMAALMMLGLVIAGVVLVVYGWRSDPFSAEFAGVHLLPHILGLQLLMSCSILAYGADFKAAWLYLLAPAQAFDGFARGVYAALCLPLVLIPNAILVAVFAWPWGPWRAGLFAAYSAMVGTIYLGFGLRLIEGAPFSRQLDPARPAASLLALIVAIVSAGVAVGLQYILIFRWQAVAATFTVALCIVAYFLTRSSLRAFAGAMRYHLGLLSVESGTLYQEINL